MATEPVRDESGPANALGPIFSVFDALDSDKQGTPGEKRAAITEAIARFGTTPGITPDHMRRLYQHVNIMFPLVTGEAFAIEAPTRPELRLDALRPEVTPEPTFGKVPAIVKDATLLLDPKRKAGYQGPAGVARMKSEFFDTRRQLLVVPIGTSPLVQVQGVTLTEPVLRAKVRNDIAAPIVATLYLIINKDNLDNPKVSALVQMLQEKVVQVQKLTPPYDENKKIANIAKRIGNLDVLARSSANEVMPDINNDPKVLLKASQIAVTNLLMGPEADKFLGALTAVLSMTIADGAPGQLEYGYAVNAFLIDCLHNPSKYDFIRWFKTATWEQRA